MKKIIILTVFLSFSSLRLLACCAEKIYSLFPIGEYNEKVVFIEFDFFRNCSDPMSDPTRFYFSGTVNLVTLDDSLVLLKVVDTLEFSECICAREKFYEKTKYEEIVANSYLKALKIAKQLDDFKLAKTKFIIFNDTLNTQVTYSIEDTFVYEVRYKNLISIDLTKEDIISCYPSKVAEVRYYETQNYNIIVLRLKCSFIEKKAIKHNKKRFKRLKTAFWKENADWHGVSKDYVVIQRKN